MATQSKAENYRIRTLEKGILVLNELSAAGGAIGVSRLASRLDMPKNTVFRILSTLESMGYVEQRDDTKDYILGLSAYALGQSPTNFKRLVEFIRPTLVNLVKKWNETAYLAVVRQQQVFYLDAVEGGHSVRPHSRLGLSAPIDKTACGKAFMMSARPEELELIGCARPDGIEEMRLCGYTVEDEELEPEVRSVAVPILNPSGRFVAGLSVSGPKHRFSLETIEEKIAPELLAFALRVSSMLRSNNPLGMHAQWPGQVVGNAGLALNEHASGF